MKKFLTLLTLLLSISLMVTGHAEAKRFGGGKSFGKSYQTAPAPKQQEQRTDSIQKQPATAQAQKSGALSAGKKGFMGGLLGGLLAGGLLAALFSGGAFQGIHFMDILIIAILAFIGFKLFKMLRSQKAPAKAQREAYAGHTPPHNSASQPQRNNADQQSGQYSAGGQATDVPFNLPNGFDANGFVNRARDHYMQIQQAWNTNNLAKIREYVSPQIFQALVDERAQTLGEMQNQILFINAELVRADYNSQKAEISLRFSGKYKETPQAVEEDIHDIWHLERDLTKPNAPWLIVGIES